MEDGKFKQDFFISERGLINVEFKVTTEDEVKKEKLISLLMTSMNKNSDLNGLNVKVNKIYFSGNNPITKLKELKEKVIKLISNTVDEEIMREM